MAKQIFPGFKIPENNWYQFPKDLNGYVSQLSGNEFKILAYIVRKTWGFNKAEDTISYKQFLNGMVNKDGVKIFDGLGIGRKTLYRCLKELEQKGFIEVIREEGKISSYKLKYSFSENNPCQNDTPTRVKMTPPPCQNDTTPRVKMTPHNNNRLPIVDITILSDSNESDLSDKISKKSPKKTNPDIKAFLDFWFLEYQRKTGKKYVILGGKESSLVKNLLTSIDLTELKRLSGVFFNSNDDFILKAGFTIGVFYSQINKLQSGKTKSKLSRSDLVFIEECRREREEEEAKKRNGNM